MLTSNIQVCPNCGAPYDRADDASGVTCEYCGTHIAFASDTRATFARDTPTRVFNLAPTINIGRPRVGWLRFIIFFFVFITLCPFLVSMCAVVASMVIGIFGTALGFTN